MSTYAADRETVTREAWERYAEQLRDLRGREYEEAEREAWAELQEALGEEPSM